MLFQQYIVVIVKSDTMKEYIGTEGKVIDDDIHLELLAVRLHDNYVKWYSYDEVEYD